MKSERYEHPARRGASWAAGAAALLLAVSVWLYFARPTDREAASGGAPGSAPDAPTMPAAAPASGNAGEEPPATNPVALWQAIDEDSVAELPAYKEVVQDRVLVRVSNVADSWRTGQRIAVPIPQQDAFYTPVIERIEHGFSGTRSYIGTLTVADGHLHRFTITTGPRNTFAHLSTPDGTYELTATGELGWLMPTVHMDQHVDYSQPDYIIPDAPPVIER